MSKFGRKKAAKEFIYKWTGRGNEREDTQSFWIDLFQKVLLIENPTDYLEFEKKAEIDQGVTKYIDLYIPSVRVLVEQKSLGVALNRKYPQSDGKKLTPFEQARRYGRNLPLKERPRWIITSNFREIWIYDEDKPGSPPEIIKLEDLEKDWTRLSFLVNKKDEHLERERRISVQAGEIVGKLYNTLLKEYNNPEDKETLESLNVLIVRLVFLLYAEDAGILERGQFLRFMEQFRENPGNFRREIQTLFDVLDTPKSRRDPYLEEDLMAFPYVNGGLFRTHGIEIPRLNEEIIHLLLEEASGGFDWSEISPTIFGALFESTINPEERRSGGMHYTSLENIHKVIDPLFLDGLKQELSDIKESENIRGSRTRALNRYIDKLAGLKFLDPACGSGNFLTESYLSLRRLENEALRELTKGQIRFLPEEASPIRVKISQFYGIEINDFAVAVANTALFIAENQMMRETESILRIPIDFLPLESFENIREGNALRMDWNEVLPASECDYIMGNPPFVGASMMTPKQKKEAVSIFGKIRLSNSIDYVGAWFIKAAHFIKKTDVKVAFVATNSITQGEQVYPLWNKLLNEYRVKIQFAYRTFKWSSQSYKKAAVHCVIIGFTEKEVRESKRIFMIDGSVKTVDNINPYLLNAPNVMIKSRGKPISKVPKITMGNKPTDHGQFILSKEEASKIVIEYPELKPYIKKYIGSREFLYNDYRYCFWLKEAPPEILRNKLVRERLRNIAEFRKKSSAAPTRKKAETPHLFFSDVQPTSDYILIPRVSSENRRYIPIGIMNSNIIASDACSITHGGGIYEFGVLMSNVHNAWMRAVAGRLKSDYRYSGGVVYNTFPWPEPTEAQKERIEETAQNILDVRAKYPDSSLADLYDELTMPENLRKAHQANDRAVMESYGFDYNLTETEIVSELMRLYEEKTTV